MGEASTPPSGKGRLANRRAETTLGLGDQAHQTERAAGIDADRDDPLIDEEARNFRIVRGRFAADADVTAAPLGAGDRLTQHFHHAGIALVEVESHDLRNPDRRPERAG